MKIKDYTLKEEDRINNFRELLDRSVRLHPDLEAFIVKLRDGDSPEYRHVTFTEFRKEVDALGTALVDLGLKGEKIAVTGENRYEWCLSYLAVTCGCGVVVPIDKELHPDEIAMILNTSEASAIVFSGKMFDKNLAEALAMNSTVKVLICMDEEEHEI